ncbi:LptE family protein [Geobacter sp.]|uniref:LptE family protein n=1 Tax=Geobacter sp. TaxID=46610 RepID=UPI0027B8CC37|nr:LptE family protein [Geobacter sp.]
MKGKIVRLVATVLSMLVVAGCGYHVMKPARGGAGPDGKTLEVSIFANRSFRPNIEATLTDIIVDELVKREGTRLVESGGELILSGAVLSYGTSAVSYTAIDEVKEYRATVTSEITLRKSGTGQVVWKGTLTSTQDFPAQDDLVVQQNSEEAAIREICRKLAREVYIHLTEDF